MKNTYWLLVIALLASLGCLVAADSEQGGMQADKIAKSLEGMKFSVSQAVLAAEKETGGKTIGVELELEDGKVVVEVYILKTGQEVQVLEVEVEGETNKIVKCEPADDEDLEGFIGEDDEEDDDDDDDDDEDDEDDEDDDDDDDDDDDEDDDDDR